MLEGGDLGFWFRLVVGFIAVLFPPALGLVVRHKWCRAVARREEIRRLCDLTSKDSVLTELESNTEHWFRFENAYDIGNARGNSDAYGYEYRNVDEYGYGDGDVTGGDFEVQMADVAFRQKEVGGGVEGTMPGRSSQKVMHPCAMCSCPSNQKCARCKFVYYCSGKCQIAHWRQGHSDECQTYNLSRTKESAMTPHLKVSKREDGRDDNCFIAGEDSNAKHGETSRDRPVFPETGISVLHSRNDGFEVEHLEDDNGNYRTSKYVNNFKHLSAVNGSHVSHGSRRSIRHFSAKVNDIKIQTAPANYARYDLPALENDYSINSVDDEHDVSGSQVSPHDIGKISLRTRSQQTVRETKKPSNSYTHISEETERYVPRESLKSSGYGLGHVKPTDPNLKPMPMPAKLAPTTSSGKVESGISCLNKLESRKPNSVTSKRATDPLPSSLQRPLKQHARDYATEMLTKYKGLFPYDLFLKLYNWKEVQFRPCGFVNYGNSCYANAVLQCLASTPPLTSYFLQGLHSKSCGKIDWCFACEFENLILRVKAGASHLSPIRIILHLQNIGRHLKNGREEDAHEFLRYAIDTMQSTSLIEAGLKESFSLEEGTTLLGLTFGGIVRSKIECMRCGSKSARHEKMMDLTVEINGDMETLEEALKQYTSVETLDDANKYRCGCCNSFVKAKKKLKVMEAPNVLTIALKRYQLGEFGKLNKRVQFSEILNLAPYICGTSDKSPIYGLYGVIVHLDTKNAAFSGHYVCYVKNSQNQWFMVDDSVVKGVDIGMVLTRDAYMLFYARYSPRAPRLIRSSVIPRDPTNFQYDMCKSRSLCQDSWGVSASEAPLNGEACLESTNSVHTSLRSRMVNPDYGSSDNSTFFSESLSCGTDSSNRDSAINDEHLNFVAMSAFWNNCESHSPDSDTSSSSSSLSPLCP